MERFAADLENVSAHTILRCNIGKEVPLQDQFAAHTFLGGYLAAISYARFRADEIEKGMFNEHAFSMFQSSMHQPRELEH